MSVGTSLAFEGEGANGIRSADCVMLNLRTLIRNASQAYESGDKEATDVDQLVDDVSSDLRLIGTWLEQIRKSKPIQMVVYCPDYSKLKSDFPKADLVDHSESSTTATPKQKAYAKLVEKVLEKLLKHYGKLIVETKARLPDFNGKGIVLTHHVVDLTTAKGIGRLWLLESHTGTLKPFTLWYTKLTGGGELHFIPFNRLTIQIFGDKSTNFKASSHGIRELVKKLAQDNHWTSATTMGRIRGTINNLPQGVDKAGLLLML
jgi:hypothetical protein